MRGSRKRTSLRTRYKGQHHSIKIAMTESDDAGRLRARFDQEYLRRYGHANTAVEAEIVVLHSLATLKMNRPEIAGLAKRGSARTMPEMQVRLIYFLEDDRFLPTQVYDRYALGEDFSGNGPACRVSARTDRSESDTPRTAASR